jgi:hypothetical protein
LRVRREASHLADKALLKQGANGERLRQQPGAAELALRQLEDCQRVAPRLGDDALGNLPVQGTCDDRGQQVVGVLGRESVDLQFGESGQRDAALSGLAHRK